MTQNLPPRSRPAEWLALIGCRLILVMALGPITVASAAGEGLILGVHPYLSHSELQVRFEPLTQHLAQVLGSPVSIRIGRDYQEHVDAIGADEIDLAYLGPVSLLEVTRAFGPKPLLAMLEHSGRAVLDGHIVVRSDSDIRELADLAGRSFGFGDPNSTMSSVVPIAVLRSHGIAPDQIAPTRYRGHGNIALAVLSGQVAAGAVKSEVYERFRERGLRSLYRLPEVAEHVFVARADLPEPLISKAREALSGLRRTPAGLRILRSLHPQATALLPVTLEHYDGLRALLEEGG